MFSRATRRLSPVWLSGWQWCEAGQVSRIQAVVFDLGGVLIDVNYRYLYRKLLPSDQAVEEFLALFAPRPGTSTTTEEGLWQTGLQSSSRRTPNVPS